MIHLCVLRVAEIPPIPSDFDVPVFVFKVDLKEDDWDLATRQVYLKLLFSSVFSYNLINWWIFVTNCIE